MNETSNKLKYSDGLKSGIGIGLAYLAVSFTFGITAAKQGLSPLFATLISATNLTSAGQFAGLNLIAVTASLFEIFLVTLVINSRYLLMSVSLSQQLDGSFGTIKRLVMSIFVTDEIFAVASTKKTDITFPFYFGLVTIPYFSWVIGTLLGSIAMSLLPAALQAAMGIALYCMFIAIIVPPAKKSKGIVFCIALAIAFSCALEFVPFLSFISSGFRVIIASLFAAIVTSLIFPIETQNTEAENV